MCAPLNAQCLFNHSVDDIFFSSAAVAVYVCLLSVDDFLNTVAKVNDETGKRKANGEINEQQFGGFYVSHIVELFKLKLICRGLVRIHSAFGGHLNANIVPHRIHFYFGPMSSGGVSCRSFRLIHN